ncbi:MAG: preprotein translocase subunit TatB [bacterium]|nr:preprotein translocase subunit TatB [bacterium]
MAERVDARGLSCPQPVMLTRRALEAAGSGEVVVALDTITHVQNCTRAAEKLGWQARCGIEADAYELTLTRSPSGPGQA